MRAFYVTFIGYFCVFIDMKISRSAVVFAVLCSTIPATKSFAQLDSADMSGMMQMMNMNMPGAVLLSVPMSQEGSGTSWHPESNPMYAAMYQMGDWMTMLHGHISIRYDHQGSKRGGNDFDAPNYIMGMTQHTLGDNSQIMFRSMLSLDWFTEGGNGYPLLLQTGETWHGNFLIDRQHPHDLFAELATAISTEFNKDWSGFIYLGYPGEPAIGPPAFMHRLSAMSNPDAPISHHWQDATHITFGVATAGIKFDRFKIEGSLFTGAAPDENRLDFDKPLMDSYSGRISYNPTSELAFQFSRAFEKNPDRDFSNEWLSTASAMYTHVFNDEEWISSTLVWSSKMSHHSAVIYYNPNPDTLLVPETSVLAESEFHFSRFAMYGRFEYVEKAQAELGMLFSPKEKVPVKEFTLGITRRIFDYAGIDVNLGVQGTLNVIPANIAFVYDENANPLQNAFEIYISLHPKLSTMVGM
jgi:hypothetical protein